MTYRHLDILVVELSENRTFKKKRKAYLMTEQDKHENTTNKNNNNRNNSWQQREKNIITVDVAFLYLKYIYI